MGLFSWGNEEASKGVDGAMAKPAAARRLTLVLQQGHHAKTF
jgi:hypothetical protein